MVKADKISGIHDILLLSSSYTILAKSEDLNSSDGIKKPMTFDREFDIKFHRPEKGIIKGMRFNIIQEAKIDETSVFKIETEWQVKIEQLDIPLENLTEVISIIFYHIQALNSSYTNNILQHSPFPICVQEIYAMDKDFISEILKEK